MTIEQLEVIKTSVRSAFAVLTSAEIERLVKDPYEEFRQESLSSCVAA